MNLPNPFIDSAAASEMMAGSAACLRSVPAAPAAANFKSVALMPSSPAEVAAVASSPGAAAVVVSESAAPLPAQADRADTAGAAGPTAAPAVFPGDDTPRIHKLSFAPWEPSVFAALEAELKKPVHPRDLDGDLPLFLRKPSSAFLRALFQLAGDAR